MKHIVKALSILSLIFMLPLVAQADENSLYNQLGGKAAIRVVVDDFVTNVAADKRINYFFKNTDISTLKKMLVEQLCMATGGPCQYEGKSMHEVHKGMGVKDKHFNALAEDLYKAMDDNGVPYHTQNKIMAMLAPMEKVIVK